MIKPEANESRLRYLSRVLYAFMKKNGIAAECTIDYDETTCDGNCLSSDFLYEVGLDEWNLNEDGSEVK